MVEEKDIEKLVKDLISTIASNQIEEDLKIGRLLKDKCKGIYRKTINCDSNHKDNVINYILRVDRIYHPIVILYARVNYIPITKGNGYINCKTIDEYVFIIEKIKEAKDANDNYEHLCELLKKKNNFSQI